MRTAGIFIAIILWIAQPASAQDQHTLTFAGEKITINCSARDPMGFCKTIAIVSSTPLLVYFMKNDKTEASIMGNNVNIYYKKNEQGNDVSDIVIDGKNWWSARCLYYVTTWTNANSVVYNGNRLELISTLHFEQTGFPFSISKIAKTESF